MFFMNKTTNVYTHRELASASMTVSTEDSRVRSIEIDIAPNKTISLERTLRRINQQQANAKARRKMIVAFVSTLVMMLSLTTFRSSLDKYFAYDSVIVKATEFEHYESKGYSNLSVEESKELSKLARTSQKRASEDEFYNKNITRSPDLLEFLQAIEAFKILISLAVYVITLAIFILVL